MPVIYPYKATMTRGELTPLVQARADLEYFQHGLEECTNFIPLRYGGVTRRPGTFFVQETAVIDKSSRLIPFVFSAQQAYMLEFGHNVIRVFAEQAPVLSGMTQVEIVSPYSEADLIDLRYVGSGDRLILVHPTIKPWELIRTSHTSWTMHAIEFTDGPYLEQNIIPTATVTRSGAGPTYTLTFDATTSPVNFDGTDFTVDDDARYIRIADVATPTDWTVYKIQSILGPLQVTAKVKLTHGVAWTGTATPLWRLDAWNPKHGYPHTVSYYQQRLFFANTAYQPETVWGSRPYYPYDFKPGALDDDAVQYDITGEQVSEIQWLKEGGDLAMGTLGSTRALGPGDSGALTPTSYALSAEADYRCIATPPVRIGGVILFAGAFGRTIREFVYAQERQGYVAPDITLLSEHLLADGILEMAYVQEPLSVLYVLTVSGSLVSITYDREQNVTGFAPHEIGGDAIIESIASIPGAFSDELWMICVRTIDEVEVRYIEVIQDPFWHGTQLEDAWYLDCASFYVGPDASTFAGLDYLEGETVSLWSEGAYIGDVEVVAGEITLPGDRVTNNLIVGLPFTSTLKTLPFHADVYGEGDVVSDQMLINQCKVDIYRSLDFMVSAGESPKSALGRNPDDPMGAGPQVRTGMIDVDIGDNWQNGGQLELSVALPTPLLVRAIKIGLDV